MGIDSHNVKNIQNKYDAQSRSAVEKVMNITTTPYAHTTSTEKPEQTSMEEWTVKKPPYDSSWGSAWSLGTDGIRVVEHLEDPYTTELSCDSYMELSGASNQEWNATYARSEILVWFQMPTTGYIKAKIYLYCRETPYSGSLEDELGFSDAQVEQKSWCYLGTSKPQSGKFTEAPLLQHFKQTDDEGSWSGNYLPSGTRIEIPVKYEHEVFGAGQNILVGIGIRDDNYIKVNDMSYNTSMTSQWYLTEVWLTSTFP